MLKKIKIEKIKKLPRVLEKNAFLTFLILLFLALIFGGITFYRYSIMVQRMEPEILKAPIQFKEETFQEILRVWQEREKEFKETELKEYPDLFRAPILFPEKLTE